MQTRIAVGTASHSLIINHQSILPIRSAIAVGLTWRIGWVALSSLAAHLSATVCSLRRLRRGWQPLVLLHRLT